MVCAEGLQFLGEGFLELAFEGLGEGTGDDVEEVAVGFFEEQGQVQGRLAVFLDRIAEIAQHEREGLSTAIHNQLVDILSMLQNGHKILLHKHKILLELHPIPLIQYLLLPSSLQPLLIQPSHRLRIHPLHIPLHKLLKLPILLIRQTPITQFLLSLFEVGAQWADLFLSDCEEFFCDAFEVFGVAAGF